MKTIQYELKSKSRISVEIPIDYANKAKNWVSLILELEDFHNLIPLISKYPYLSNPGILARTTSLIKTEKGTPESLELQDEVYLRVCVYENEQNMKRQKREESIEEFNRTLNRIINDL